jgi:DNA-binding NtrC family response regulator
MIYRRRRPWEAETLSIGAVQSGCGEVPWANPGMRVPWQLGGRVVWGEAAYRGSPDVGGGFTFLGICVTNSGMADNEVTRSSILIVDDEQDHAQVMCEALQRLGHRCDVSYNLAEAEGRLGRKNYDLIVTDLMMEGKPEGLDVLRRAVKLAPPPPVILVTAHGDVPTCKAALSEGAYDYIEKPLDLDYFRAQVSRAAEKAALQKQNQILQEQIEGQAGFEGIIGTSPAMRQVVQVARQVAMSDIPVLILGESGTGKELVARSIHNNSRRRKARMVNLNCAGLSESILEDELFGHVKGAFTGAQTDRAGRFEHADEGTLFLDEIGDMPSAMQAKLLRVLENGELVRLGSNDPIQVNVRFISATNRNIDEMVAEREFREDLYFRIKGTTILIPPLRERREDIAVLLHYFLTLAADKYAKQIDGLTPEAQQTLMSYHWPGNVRQLKNVIENMVVLSNGPLLDVDALPPDIRPRASAESIGGMNNLVGISIEQAEKELIRNTLKMVSGNREQAAKILGIGERTLYRKIKEYEM